jgi:hypothetical protein
LQGFAYIGHRPLQVDGPAGRSECSFVHISNGEHSGWCRDIGFALTVSKSKHAGNVWLHELAAFTDPEEKIDLSSDEELLAFLICCVPGARITDPSIDKLSFLAEHFDDLAFYGWFAGYFHRARSLQDWSSDIAVLNDAVDEETLNTMAWLAALSDTPAAVTRMGFSFDADSNPDRHATFRLPVLANTVRASVIAWLECSGYVLLGEETQSIRGITVDRVESLKLEIRPRSEKRTNDPEFLFDSQFIVARGRHGYYKVDDGVNYEDYPSLTWIHIAGL